MSANNEKSSKAPVINVKPNVIEGDELKELFNTVFGQMAGIVSNTYGPFGANTAYQLENKILTTKDGWSVEQGIIYPRSFIASLIRRMILDVSLAINNKAGDGTTTGLIAAYEINKAMMEYTRTHTVHSKFLMNAMMRCVDKICSILEDNADAITEENMSDMIYRIALVSLDWDTEFAGFIRDIYMNTKNPIIRIQDSGTESSNVEYREGYDISGRIVSEFKVNNLGERKYTVNDPLILIFTYTLNASMFEPIITAATFFASYVQKELVIMAPDFEKSFRDSYNALCIRQTKSGQPLPNFVMARYHAEYNIEREMLNDFCFLTGANLITREYSEAEDIIREFVQASKQMPPVNATEEDMATFNKTMQENAKTFYEKIGDFMGTCDEITIDEKLIVAKGFSITDELLEQRRKTIQASINKMAKDMNAKSMITDEYALKKNRLGKLRLKYGIINVGGFGEGYLKAKRDALDDAVNACNNAYTYGVTMGGGIAIPVAVEQAMEELKNGTWAPDELGVDNQILTDILSIIGEGFIRTTHRMIENRYTDDIVDDVKFDGNPGMKESVTSVVKDALKLQENGMVLTRMKDIVEATYRGEIGMNDTISLMKDAINCKESGNVPGVSLDEENPKFPILALIMYCIKQKQPWNLITKKLDPSIIHPVKVEVEVLRGCLHLVLVATTTNQLLYSGYDGIEEELKDMREVEE